MVLFTQYPILSTIIILILVGIVFYFLLHWLDYHKAPIKSIKAAVTKRCVEKRFFPSSFTNPLGTAEVSGSNYSFIEIECKHLEARAQYSKDQTIEFSGDVSDDLYNRANQGSIGILFQIGQFSKHIKICGVQ